MTEAPKSTEEGKIIVELVVPEQDRITDGLRRLFSALLFECEEENNTENLRAFVNLFEQIYNNFNPILSERERKEAEILRQNINEILQLENKAQEMTKALYELKDAFIKFVDVCESYVTYTMHSVSQTRDATKEEIEEIRKIGLQ